MGFVRERFAWIAIAALIGGAGLGGGLIGCGGNDDESQDSGTDGVSASDDAVGQDAEAKAAARNGQVALEVYATDKNGSYAGATAESLAQIEPTLSDAELTVSAEDQTYEVTAESESGNSFTVSRDASGAVTMSCETEGEGGCPDGGQW